MGLYDFEPREREVSLTEEEGSRELMEMQEQLHHGDVENEVEFWPVEHPMEPQDEDRPVKCPIPTSSSLIDDGRIGEERCAESLKKRAMKKEDIVIADAEEVPRPRPRPRAMRKRHHTLTNGNHTIMPSTRRTPSFSPHNVTIFQMLQRLDEFES
ncbi:hypothetical protein M5689_015033 [Euphorbia peplus]|nr:hypothetical protein M5689_015033 [Euphorbia peplus]